VDSDTEEVVDSEEDPVEDHSDGSDESEELRSAGMLVTHVHASAVLHPHARTATVVAAGSRHAAAAQLQTGQHRLERRLGVLVEIMTNEVQLLESRQATQLQKAPATARCASLMSVSPCG
jgi:hypothetical protein